MGRENEAVGCTNEVVGLENVEVVDLPAKAVGWEAPPPWPAYAELKPKVEASKTVPRSMGVEYFIMSISFFDFFCPSRYMVDIKLSSIDIWQ